MTQSEAFNKLLDDKENGLPSDKRKVWKHRFSKGELSERLILAELRNYGYKETAPNYWA